MLRDKNRHAPPDKSRRVSRTKSRPVVASDRNQIYWRGVFRNFLPIRERLRLPYGDKRFAPKKSLDIRIARKGRCIYSPFLSAKEFIVSLHFECRRDSMSAYNCVVCALFVIGVSMKSSYSRQEMIHEKKSRGSALIMQHPRRLLPACTTTCVK